MKFSETFRTSGWLCEISTNGGYIASAHQHKLVIRTSDSEEVVKCFTCDDAIEKIEWSPDSQLLLCVICKRCQVQIFSLKDCEWKCKITEGSAGLIDAFWCPDSRHILTVGEFHACVSVWSLVNCTVLYIHNLKSNATPAISFSPNANSLAAIEAHGTKDKISIFNPSSWKLTKHLLCDDFLDVGGMSWSPNGTTLCVWDNKLHQCSVKLLCVEAGLWIGQYKHGCLGVKSVAWVPSGQILAVGCWDGTVLLLNYISWKPLAILNHYNEVNDAECKIYKQTLNKCDGCIFEEVRCRPVTVIPLAWDKGGDSWQHRGVSLLSFSSCGRWLATREDSTPALAWVWDLRGHLITVVIHTEPVTDISWNPQKAHLMTATNTASVVVLRMQKGAENITVPKQTALGEVLVKKILWEPFGRYAILLSRSRFVILKPTR